MEFNLQFTTNENILSRSTLYDVLIIGAGPAGLNASLYAKRKGLEVGMITTKIGGQVINTSTVDNYLGFKYLNGEALIDEFMNHIKPLDIPLLDDVTVESIEKNDNQFTIILTNGNTYQSKTIILATGAKPRQLNIPGEKEYIGKGVAYCAICDAPLFKDKDVIIAGGGNSAVEAALDLEKVAKSVTLVHRSEFRADKILLKQLENKEHIKLYLQTKITKVIGQGKMTGIEIHNEDGNSIINADGLFIEIGTIPNLNFTLNELKVNSYGEIIVDDKAQTNISGVFACGDITNSPYKQIITSVAEGAKAALSANLYLNRLHK